MGSGKKDKKDKKILAAGCVVWRMVDGAKEVAVVHRDRYDDWSHPKGKLDAGESFLDCAVREVEEETGFRGAIHAQLPTVRYTDHKGRAKTVYYWSMEHMAGDFAPNDEVDEVRWMPPEQAKDLLTYSHDLHLLDFVV